MAEAESDIEQISLSLSVERNAIAPAHAACKQRQQREVNSIRQRCVKGFGERPEFGLHERLAPFHVCVSTDFEQRVRQVHHLLNRAIIDVVMRWFDEGSTFAKRMPLEPREESILRWMATQSDVQPFTSSFGMWRTDYLVEGDVRGKNQIKVCEINARIPFNGIWLIGCHGEAYENVICKEGLDPPKLD